MAIEFKVHVTDTEWSSNTNAKWYLENASEEINKGFVANSAAHSAAVNAILHETSLVVTAFAGFINDDAAITTKVDPSTTLANMKATIATRLTNYIGAATAKKVSQQFKYTLNGGTQQEYDGETEKTLSFYAPVVVGSIGQLLVSGGSTDKVPTWLAGNVNNSSTTYPVYVTDGCLAKCSQYAGGTKVTLNGTNKGADDASFFAPITSIAADKYKVLVSNGASAPVWSSLYVTESTASDVTYLRTAHNTIYIGKEDLTACAFEISGKFYVDAATVDAATIKGGLKVGTNLANNSDVAINVNDVFTVTKEGNITNVKDITSSTTIQAQTFNSTSDFRLKDNIIDFVPQKSILDLPIKEFDFKKDGSHHIGCIAQDLQKICPELVHEDSEGYLNIEESKLIYLLIHEVKELKKEIEILKGAK